MSISKNFLAIFKRDTFLYLTSILNGIFLARTLGPSALGIWGILTFVTSCADGFVRTKADNAAVYFLGKKKYNKDDLILKNAKLDNALLDQTIEEQKTSEKIRKTKKAFLEIKRFWQEE